MTQTYLTDDWAATVTEGQSAHAQDAVNELREKGDLETKQALCERAAAHAATAAAEHFPELPVEAIKWETSTLMERSAGKAIYDSAGDDEAITIRLSWDAYQEYGWVTVRARGPSRVDPRVAVSRARGG